MKQLLVITATILLLASCKNKEEKRDTTELTQMERVMAVHDEVMPKMGTIGKLVSQLEAKPDSLKSTPPYQTAIKDLKDAHDYMMTWMVDFNKRFDHDEAMKGKELSEQKKIWLNEEEEKVKVMRDKVINSIKNAKALLANEAK